MLKHVNSKIAILGSRFYYFKLVFDSKRISGLRNIQGNIFDVNFDGRHFFKWIKNLKKPPIFLPKLSKNVVTCAILTVDVSNKNDCKLDKIPRNVY